MPPKTAKKPHCEPAHSTALVPAGPNRVSAVNGSNVVNGGDHANALAIVEDVSSPVEGLRNFVERQSEVSTFKLSHIQEVMQTAQDLVKFCEVIHMALQDAT
jgi:hypothetical protein